MIRTKPLDMADLTRPDFYPVVQEYNRIFKPGWSDKVPCRYWEYAAAVIFSELDKVPEKDRKNIKVCDAGSGTECPFTQYVALMGFETHAFDIRSRGHLDLGGGKKIIYHNMSLINPTFAHNEFDYVFCISSIEHVNAQPRFVIPDLPFDTGDTQAMLELSRILKPGGVLVLTTDYADKYAPPPGLMPHGHGSHRVYDWDSILSRLVNPAIRQYQMRLWGGFETECDWDNIEKVEPMGQVYTEFIFTLKKKA